MTRKIFLTVAAFIAFAVGAFALAAPAVLLSSKGVATNAAAAVWVREVGILLVSVGLLGFLVREHPDSPTMKAVLIANAFIQFALFPIEIAAYLQGIITSISGIIPNSAIHLILGTGFLYYIASMKNPGDSGRQNSA